MCGSLGLGRVGCFDAICIPEDCVSHAPVKFYGVATSLKELAPKAVAAARILLNLPEWRPSIAS